ncbi:Prephenate dehydratase-domain-containing protein [Delphinella strobiligena]|nr:Prephenate dehydratase-domain-containing protein [Delphinella strobiligena]
MQPREEIAYLGPKASYTHQATLSAFDSEHHILLPQTTIEDVFSSVQSGHATYGVVPFENSTNGSVVFTLDLFADQHIRHPDIVVCGERYVEVHHCLLGHPAPQQQDGLVSGHPNPSASRAQPLHPLSHIKKLYSHPQAWGQCKTFLSCHLKMVERQDVSSTSRAAELVAADETGTTAAISSGIAAQMHKVDFLAKDIEDDSENCTRFLILKKLQPQEDTDGATSQTAALDGDAAGPENHSNGQSIPSFKSLLSFTISHTDPGALADALAVFKTHGLNLTSINPRPSGEAPWHYIFFVEFQGKRGQQAVNQALEDLDRVVRGWRWLGSWENKLEKG